MGWEDRILLRRSICLRQVTRRVSAVLWITPQHFDRVPKGMGFFAIKKTRFLAALPQERTADVNDDTRLFRTIVQEKAILVSRDIRPVYMQRQNLWDVSRPSI